MRDTATGRITFGVFALADMVAASEAFRTKVGAEDADAAMAHIYRWQLRGAPVVLQEERPCALIWQPRGPLLAQYGGGSYNLLSGHGGVVLILTDVDSSARADRQASGDTFAKWVDQVVNDIADLAGASDNLDLSNLEVLQPIMHSPDWDDASTGSSWDTVFLGEWGLPG